MNNGDLLKEDYEIFNVVNQFDKNLLTVKGWGVTLALAALAWGFKESHFGMFLVAAIDGISFWLVEGSMKRHQMRYYFRMREIEELRYDQEEDEKGRKTSSPRIDSGWGHAGPLFRGKGTKDYQPTMVTGPKRSYQWAWFFSHVAFPHVVSVLAGIVLFLLGFLGKLGMEKW